MPVFSSLFTAPSQQIIFFADLSIFSGIECVGNFPLATIKNTKDFLKPNPERESVIISSVDLKTYISDGTTHTLNTTNVLTVMKGGNDASALTAGKYDFLSPWLNPTIAMASAAVGDVVVVYPGEYTIGVGGNVTRNKGTLILTKNQQDYDLQTIVEDASSSGEDDDGNAIDFSGKVGDKRISLLRFSTSLLRLCGASMAITGA